MRERLPEILALRVSAKLSFQVAFCLAVGDMSLCGGMGWRDYPVVWFTGFFEFSGSLERQGCAVPDGLNFVEVVFSGSLNC